MRDGIHVHVLHSYMHTCTIIMYLNVGQLEIECASMHVCTCVYAEENDPFVQNLITTKAQLGTCIIWNNNIHLVNNYFFSES